MLFWAIFVKVVIKLESNKAYSRLFVALYKVQSGQKWLRPDSQERDAIVA